MYAFEQDVPINAAVYARIMERIRTDLPLGLIAHVALEREDGHLYYLDLWETKTDCDAFTEDRLHPAVGAALAAAGVEVASEPPRREVTVVDAWGAGFTEQAAR